MSSQKIRIRLKGYDHEVVDQSAKLIVDTAQKTGARVSDGRRLRVTGLLTEN